MSNRPYFPESKEELYRLQQKTDISAVISQARWAGLLPGMRILDVGCGPGLTTCALVQAAQPGGSGVGVDRSLERVVHANETYAAQNIAFVNRNFFDDLSDLGQFDFVWMRFIHEYFLEEAYQLTEHVAKSVKPGGILCLIDLDQNCLRHYGHSDRLNKNICEVINSLMTNHNFDPYAGVKLYEHIYRLGFTNIQSDVRAHHLIYGELSERDRDNFWKKLGVEAVRSGWTFADYEDGFIGFETEFKDFFASHRRFWYTPLILCRGIKP